MITGATWLEWAAAFAVSFAVLEGLAVLHHQTTLSRAIWKLEYKWPLFGPLWGLVIGTLSAHFFWGGPVCFAPVAP
jgi:hypothetical protein